MTLTFDCVYYYVSDLDRSVAFYRDVLGFELISRDLVARFDVDGVCLELVPTRYRQRFSGKGNARLCLRVDHMTAARNDLVLQGVVSSEPVDQGPGLLCILHDLDGNEICLWQEKETGRKPRSSTWAD